MKQLLKILVLVVALNPVKAFANEKQPYESFQALLDTLYSAGFERIFEMPGGDWSSVNIRLHQPGNTSDKGVNIGVLQKSKMVRVPAFDYVDSPRALSYGVAEAYKVADVLLCYKLKSNFMREAVQGSKTLKCLMFPTEIDVVEKAVKVVNP